MSSYKDLEIYKLAYDLSIRVHRESLKLYNYIGTPDSNQYPATQLPSYPVTQIPRYPDTQLPRYPAP